jgi:hypothetical protein
MSATFPVIGEKYKLSHTFNVWHHKTNDRNWKPSSYTLLHSFSDLRGFWDFFQKHPNPHTGMYFLMVDPVIPTWEDTHNQPGGCWSFKLERSDALASWTHLAMTMVANIMTKKTEDMRLLNGISLTLRKHNAVIKVWQNDKNNSDVKKYIVDTLPNLGLDDCIFQKHEGRD